MKGLWDYQYWPLTTGFALFNCWKNPMIFGWLTSSSLLSVCWYFSTYISCLYLFKSLKLKNPKHNSTVNFQFFCSMHSAIVHWYTLPHILTRFHIYIHTQIFKLNLTQTKWVCICFSDMILWYVKIKLGFEVSKYTMCMHVHIFVINFTFWMDPCHEGWASKWKYESITYWWWCWWR